MPNAYAIQFDIIWENKQANHQHLEALLQKQQPEPGSLIVLPELFDVGFTLNTEHLSEEVTNFASEKWCAHIAQKYQIYLQGASIRQPNNPPKKATNNAIVFNPEGKLICRYEKIVPFSGGNEHEKYQGGKSLASFNWNGLRVCPLICYDLRFPELWRLAVTDLNCQMFTCGASWPAQRSHHWTTLLTARAIENQSFVIGVNRTGNDPSIAYDGHSIILDPLGRTLTQAGPQPTIIHAPIDTKTIQQWRKQFPALNDIKRNWLGKINN